MPKVLDRDRDFAVVQGGDTGISFVQDDTNFNGAGEEIVPGAEPAVEPSPAEPEVING